MSSESFKKQESLRKRIEKEGLTEKTFDEVKDEILEWDEAADIDVKKIEQIFNGEETDEDSENEKEKKNSKKSDGPIQIDSAEEVIELEDSDEKSGRSRDRRDKRRYRKREPHSDHSDDPKKRKLDESSDRYENDSRDR